MKSKGGGRNLEKAPESAQRIGAAFARRIESSKARRNAFFLVQEATALHRQVKRGGTVDGSPHPHPVGLLIK